MVLWSDNQWRLTTLSMYHLFPQRSSYHGPEGPISRINVGGSNFGHLEGVFILTVQVYTGTVAQRIGIDRSLVLVFYSFGKHLAANWDFPHPPSYQEGKESEGQENAESAFPLISNIYYFGVSYLFLMQICSSLVILPQIKKWKKTGPYFGRCF